MNHLTSASAQTAIGSALHSPEKAKTEMISTNVKIIKQDSSMYTWKERGIGEGGGVEGNEGGGG